VNVVLNDVPTAEFTTNPLWVSNPGSLINFTDLSSTPSGALTSWIWFFGDSASVGSLTQNPVHTYGADGTYNVMLIVQNSYGCWDTVIHSYEVVSDIMVPNVFTPNNDGRNDYLAFKNLGFFPGTALTVFNRWGNKIFESPDYQNNWNGDNNNDGVYYFILENSKFDEPVVGFFQIIH
jgi:gliding motility-associated-like protein